MSATKSISLLSRLRAGLAYPTWLPALAFFLIALPFAPPKAHGTKNLILVASLIILLSQPILSWLYLRSRSFQEFDETHASFALTLNVFFFTVSAGFTAIVVATLPLIALWYFVGMWFFMGLLLWLSAWTACSTSLSILAMLGIRIPDWLNSRIRNLKYVRAIHSTLAPTAELDQIKQPEL